MKTTTKECLAISVSIQLTENGKRRKVTRIFNNPKSAADFWLEHKFYELNHRNLYWDDHSERIEKMIERHTEKIYKIFEKMFKV